MQILVYDEAKEGLTPKKRTQTLIFTNDKIFFWGLSPLCGNKLVPFIRVPGIQTHNCALNRQQQGAHAPVEEGIVKHVRRISVSVPVPAQLESILQVIGVAQALLALFNGIMNTFGIPIPQKGGDAAS